MAVNPFRNFGLKIAALGLGTLLWLMVSGQQVERSVSVPVFYRNTPAGLLITGHQLEDVNVHLRGGYSQISQLGRNDVAVVADLADSKAGVSVIALGLDQVSAPLGVEVTQVDPGTVTVMLEKAGTIDVPIRPVIQGQPAAGYAVGQITVDPPRATVLGPVSRLETLTAATTEPISVEGLTATVTQTVNVGVADAELRLSVVRTARVTVHIVRKPGGGPGER
jgi:YbbR domain-containing protein